MNLGYNLAKEIIQFEYDRRDLHDRNESAGGGGGGGADICKWVAYTVKKKGRIFYSKKRILDKSGGTK